MAIESIMYMGIGFLLAALIAVLVIPLVHSRAERLTLRRLEASLPQSLAEVQADKDLLRADHAISTRRLELKIEHLTVELAGQLVELGKKQDAVNRLRIQRDALNLEVAALKMQSEKSTYSTALRAHASIVPSIPTASLPIQEALLARGRGEVGLTRTDSWVRDESTNKIPRPEYQTQEDTWLRDESECDTQIASTVGQAPASRRDDRSSERPPILTLSTIRQSTEEDTWVRGHDRLPETATLRSTIGPDEWKPDKGEHLVLNARRPKMQTATRRSLKETDSSHASAN
jgi:hypothetical protein